MTNPSGWNSATLWPFSYSRMMGHPHGLYPWKVAGSFRSRIAAKSAHQWKHQDTLGSGGRPCMASYHREPLTRCRATLPRDATHQVLGSSEAFFPIKGGLQERIRFGMFLAHLARRSVTQRPPDPQNLCYGSLFMRKTGSLESMRASSSHLELPSGSATPVNAYEACTGGSHRPADEQAQGREETSSASARRRLSHTSNSPDTARGP